MDIKLKDLKELLYKAGLLNFRLFNLVDGHVEVEKMPLLWESKNPEDWFDIGGKKYDDYFVQEIQTNIPNTVDIIISKNSGILGDLTKK